MNLHNLLVLMLFMAPNAAIYGRSEMALFVHVFAQNVTAHGDP